jgi:hypothetical protein
MLLQIINYHEISFFRTHNLEVPGSSPGWSTLKISNLEEIQVADFSFCENNAKTIGLSSILFRAQVLIWFQPNE